MHYILNERLNLKKYKHIWIAHFQYEKTKINLSPKTAKKIEEKFSL